MIQKFIVVHLQKLKNASQRRSISPFFISLIIFNPFPTSFGYKEDFISDLNPPRSKIRLGGMANGMLVEGIGKVKWSFKSVSDHVVINTQCYYFPSVKDRLTSSQRLFNKKAGIDDSFIIYEEYGTLYFKGLPSLKVDYDEKFFFILHIL